MIRISALLLTAGLSACSLNRAYIPMVQPVPLPAQPGDIYVGGSIQPDQGFNARVGAAFPRHVAVIAAGTYGQKDNCFSCSKQVARHIESGIGVYGTAAGWRQEGYLGGGAGRFRLLNSRGFDPEDEDQTVMSGRYSLGFAQWNAGRTGKYLDHAVSTRLSLFDFTDLERRNGGGIPLAAPRHYRGVYLEPALTLRFGYRWFKAESQIGFSLPIAQADGAENQKAWIALGIGLKGPR